MFATLVGTLRSEGYINDVGDAIPEHTMEIYSLLVAMITPEIKLTIESVSAPEMETLPPAEDDSDKSE